MKKTNLRELYPNVYTTDFFVDVTEEVMETIRAAERAEAAYERKMYRYKAYYSLDCDNGIENAILMKPQTPEMLLEEKSSCWGAALCCCDGSAREAGQADLCPVLSGYACE